LPSGGYIIVEPTEALVSIDVNSGRSTKEEGHAATVYKTNLEATEEIARQLRLRDLGGIIVVDFIDMISGKHRRDVERRMRDAMQADKARVKVGRIGENGTLELTRQRLRQSHHLISHVPCQRCNGTGRVRDAEGLAILALRSINGHLVKKKTPLAALTVKLPPDVATSLNNLARLFQAMGSFAEARPLFERALAIREKQLGPGHPEVAASLNDLAVHLEAMGSYKEAKSLYERALAILEKQLGPEHLAVATSFNNLAGLHWATGSYAEARPLLERARAIREKRLGPEHPHVATSLNNLALLLKDMGAYAEAKPIFERALAIREKQLGPEHPDVAQSLNNLAALCLARGELYRAVEFLSRGNDIREHWSSPVIVDTSPLGRLGVHDAKESSTVPA